MPHATFQRMGDWALKYKMFAAYHTHQQGSMTALDDAFAASKGNMANVDLGHFMAANDPAGTPLDFLNKFHDRIASYHLKDRTSVAHCALNLPWGTGETPIPEILQTVAKKKWTMPGSIELEYDIPEDSDAVKEVARCLEFCRRALTSRWKRLPSGHHPNDVQPCMRHDLNGTAVFAWVGLVGFARKGWVLPSSSRQAMS